MRFRLSCPALKTSTQAGSNGGNTRPGSPGGGFPASLRTVSKYSSKSGLTTVKEGPSPRAAMRSFSHFFCSDRGGRCAFPANTRAASTACHSNILNVKPAPTCT